MFHTAAAIPKNKGGGGGTAALLTGKGKPKLDKGGSISAQ